MSDITHKELEDYASEIKHFRDVHFRGITYDGQKFVYCPIGSICSWSHGDYDNQWCHWCQSFFADLDKAHS